MSSTHRALVVRDVNIEPKVEDVPMPECLHGTVVIRVLATPIISYAREIFIGNSRKYTFPLPIVPGTSAIARITSLPPDSTSPTLQPGSLVLFDCTIRLRSDPTVRFLSAIHDGFSIASKKLMRDGGVRDGSCAEYMRVPLENIYLLDENKLLGSGGGTPGTGIGTGLSYTVEELCRITRMLVPFGGLRAVNLSVGETVLIGPCTGQFGGAAVRVALAMGAKVIAWSRDQEKLDRLVEMATQESDRYAHMISTVRMTTDLEGDTAEIKKANHGKGVDVFFDINPPSSTNTSRNEDGAGDKVGVSGWPYIKPGILTLRNRGRVCLMGGERGDIPIPHSFIMHNDISIRGKWMYEPEDIHAMIRMVEGGMITLGHRGGYPDPMVYMLDEWRLAWDTAAKRSGVGEMVVIKP